MTPRSCPGCPVACCYDMEITSGPHKGYIATPCAGGEGHEGASSMVGVLESGNALYLIDLYDRLGLEACTGG